MKLKKRRGESARIGSGFKKRADPSPVERGIFSRGRRSQGCRIGQTGEQPALGSSHSTVMISNNARGGCQVGLLEKKVWSGMTTPLVNLQKGCLARY